MLTVVDDAHDTHAPVAVGGDMLDELAREGARRMLAAALQAEVAAYVDAHIGQVDEHGHRLVVRNGSHAPRQVATAAGAVSVRQPRVNDKRVDPVTGERVRFASAILAAWARKSPQVAEVLPLLYAARAVQRRLHPRVGGVLRVRGGPVAGHRDAPGRAVAGRGPRLRFPVAG